MNHSKKTNDLQDQIIKQHLQEFKNGLSLAVNLSNKSSGIGVTVRLFSDNELICEDYSSINIMRDEDE